MAWPNPFRCYDENTRSRWGYTFQLTQEHLTPEQTYPLKYSYDTLGEEALKKLDALSPQNTATHYVEKQSGDQSVLAKDQKHEKTVAVPKRDLFVLLRDNAQTDQVLGKLWAEANAIPSWVDWESLARGQDVFYRYGGPALTGLAYQSLLGGLGANRVAEVLARTGGFSTKVARHRLFETTQLILQVTQSLQSIKPGGAGHASALRARPDYYDVDRFGVPINDLDCIATIGTFSATLIWLSLPRQGIFVTKREAADYIHLWRYVAYLMGTPTEYFETPEKAKRIMEILLLYEVNPSDTSKILANNVINCLMAQPPAYASKSFLEVNSRWLNGNELCDGLGLGRPSVYYWCLMCGQCLFFMALCYTYRLIPYLDRKKVKALRKIFWAVIIESKGGLGAETTFDFKYVPDFSKRTQMEDPENSGLKQPGIERRNLQAFMFGCAFLSICGYILLRLTGCVLGNITSWVI